MNNFILSNDDKVPIEVSPDSSSSPPGPNDTSGETEPNTNTVPKKRGRGRPKLNPDRYCENCYRRNSPEWRKGENGMSLCNGCGLKYLKKLRNERKQKSFHSLSIIMNNDENEDKSNSITNIPLKKSQKRSNPRKKVNIKSEETK